MVNWYKVEIFDTAKNKVIYKNSFITNHELNESNIFSMIVGGRTRWKAVRPRVGDRRKGIVLKDICVAVSRGTPTDMQFIRERVP